MVNGGEAPSRQLEVQRGDDASLARFGRSLRSCLASDSSEFLSIFWSGALAGLVLEAAIHTTHALQARLQQLRQGHTFGTLGLKWWITAVASQPPKGPFRGAAGTLAAGTIWSGIFGSCFVPVRAAVDATAAEAGREDGGGWAPAAGAAAGALAASSVRVPLQVVRERMRRREFFCSLQAFELILTREGPAALYKGWLSSLRAVPFDAMLFMLYDTGKRRMLDPGSGQATNEHAATGLGESGATGVAAATAGPAEAAAAGVEARGPTDCSGSCTQGARPAPRAAPSEGAGAAESLAPPYRWWQAALVGGAAGAATGLVTSPLEAARAAGAEAASGPA
ncbi:hypothetical protein HYH03_015016 [Edaphochlamys debaryana]|uniref:Mitochondrial carrier protein n=1 Tax=Edaphochlamys debaryana TaxID=47281 RepID=A0A836BRN6_9CHLO|nr:hypothetical protein HYH03_015016 [Edaphochlamys debaryana]|eukprot:KAG2486312.1 hypothetical protein HYH03_015016 [Edaphochlamys debaryana]